MRFTAGLGFVLLTALVSIEANGQSSPATVVVATQDSSVSSHA